MPSYSHKRRICAQTHTCIHVNAYTYIHTYTDRYIYTEKNKYLTVSRRIYKSHTFGPSLRSLISLDLDCVIIILITD